MWPWRVMDDTGVKTERKQIGVAQIRETWELQRIVEKTLEYLMFSSSTVQEMETWCPPCLWAWWESKEQGNIFVGNWAGVITLFLSLSSSGLIFHVYLSFCICFHLKNGFRVKEKLHRYSGQMKQQNVYLPLNSYSPGAEAWSGFVTTVPCM